MGASWHYLPNYDGPWSSAYSFFWRSWLMYWGIRSALSCTRTGR
ncbi:hypothetical protein FKV70_18080 [Paenibacillus ottowii]|uniref:Uncharacterized protein n=1 Tax=Paenibacillus ottowii TaxID=2315729 RepID=A0ABY3B2L7_9BACL|nr:hypothetical protein FKV70_18080 [Paenibacillus ottowii]